MKNQIETIKVRANQNDLTFTIRKYINRKLSVKYRTIKMTKDEFDSEEMNTESEKIPERLDEFMVLHGIGQSEILEFLNKNYKSE